MISLLSLKTADKIVFKYFIRYFITSFLLFLSIFFLFSLLQIINDKDITKGLSIILILKAILYLIPSVITESLIFSSVFSVFFTVGEMSAKGELIALRSSRYSYVEINSKIILFVALLIPIIYHLNHYVIPSSRSTSRHYIRTMANRATNVNIKDNTFEKVSSSYIITEEAKHSSLKNISIIRNSSKMIEPTKRADYIINIDAKMGTYTTIKDKGLLLSLNNGRISYIDQQDPNRHYLGGFDSYMIFIPFETDRKEYATNIKFLTTKELKKLSRKDPNQTYGIEKEIWTRTSNSISLLPITVLAMIIAFLFERESKYFSFISSVGIILIYYGVEIISDSLVSKKLSYPYLKLLPFIIITLLSFFTYRYGLSKK